MSEAPSLYFEPSVDEKEEKPLTCPICGGEMAKLEGKLECPECLLYRSDLPKYKKFFKGQWLGLPNIDVKMLWKGKPISENPPICDACGKKVKGKEVERAIGHHHVSYAAYACQRGGEYREKLAELYEKIRKGKINITEVFRIENDLLKEYFRERSSAERPVESTQGWVPLKCPACRKQLGTIQVTVKARPSESPKAPSYKEYALLPKTAVEQRLIDEHFHIPQGMKLKDWLAGKDIQKFTKKLEVLRGDVNQLPFMRLPARSLGNLSAVAYTVLADLQNEVLTRSDQVYALLKSPPSPRISPTAKLLEREDRR